MLIQNILIILGACFFLWLSSSLIIKGVEGFSKQLKISSFLFSFLVLGILTSLTEISVGLNSIINEVPAIFVGNLIGGAAVIILFIIPLLAIFNQGIRFKEELDLKKILLFLIVILAPAFIVLDGIVSVYDALLILGLYGFFIYFFKSSQPAAEDSKAIILDKKAIAKCLLSIGIGATVIYFSSNILVTQVIEMAEYFQAPQFLVSLLILSIGTNLPEISVALNAIAKKETEIALGNYIGSAAANTMLFGVFTLINGSFAIDTNHFNVLIFVILTGYLAFLAFCRSKRHLSASEGLALMVIFIIFIVFQSGDLLYYKS